MSFVFKTKLQSSTGVYFLQAWQAWGIEVCSSNISDQDVEAFECHHKKPEPNTLLTNFACLLSPGNISGIVTCEVHFDIKHDMARSWTLIVVMPSSNSQFQFLCQFPALVQQSLVLVKQWWKCRWCITSLLHHYEVQPPIQNPWNQASVETSALSHQC